MSNFIIEIVEPVINKIYIETSFLDTVTDTIEIERYDTVNLEIVNTERVLASDLPDDIPMSKIIGNLHYSRINDLDIYIQGFVNAGISDVSVDDLIWGGSNVGLSGYLDQYEFDCGNP
jgi:hypothetical protein